MKNLFRPFYTVEILTNDSEDYFKKHPSQYASFTVKYFWSHNHKNPLAHALAFANEIEKFSVRVFVVRHNGKSTKATRRWEVK